MTVTIAPPQIYPVFVSRVRQLAPRFPIENESELQRDRAEAARMWQILSWVASAAGISIPEPADIGISAATSDSSGAFVNAAADMAMAKLGEIVLGNAAGPFIGGAIFITRGTHQALDRSDAMVTYLLSTGGFTNTLSRACVSAMQDPVPYTRMPMPPIPNYMAGATFCSWRRQAYMAGYNAAGDVIRRIDEARPVNGDSYSKQCLTHIGLQTSFYDLAIGQPRANHGQLRRACERIIIRDMLAINLRHQATQLRRWANSP